MQCNIDQRGRRLRFINGLVLLGIGGLIVGLWAAPNHSVWLWIVAMVLIAGGLFSLFEARKGWCALRAMGIKTKI
jgi:MFS-type transporter involved in bile tolerance (Atg22 family)